MSLVMTSCATIIWGQTRLCVFSWVRVLSLTHTHAQTHSRVDTVCFSSYFWRAVTGCLLEDAGFEAVRPWPRPLRREGNPSVLPPSPLFFSWCVLLFVLVSLWWLLMIPPNTRAARALRLFLTRIHFLDGEKLLVVVVVVVWKHAWFLLLHLAPNLIRQCLLALWSVL